MAEKITWENVVLNHYNMINMRWLIDCEGDVMPGIKIAVDVNMTWICKNGTGIGLILSMSIQFQPI